MTTAEYFGLEGPRRERIFGTAAAFVHAAIQSWRRWRRVRKAIFELRGLDDRMLSDIGLSRSTLYAAASGADTYRDRGHGGF